MIDDDIKEAICIFGGLFIIGLITFIVGWLCDGIKYNHWKPFSLDDSFVKNYGVIVMAINAFWALFLVLSAEYWI